MNENFDLGSNYEKEEKKASAEKILEILNIEEDISFEDRKNRLSEAFIEIKDSFVDVGADFYEDVNKVYRDYEMDNLIIRRDDPRNLVNCVLEKDDIDIELKDYPNCAEWTPENWSRSLSSAFLEGRASAGGMISVLAFKKGANFEVIDISEEEKSALGIDHSSAKRMGGRVNLGDLQFAVLGVPVALFPEEQMSDLELEKWDKIKGSKALLEDNFNILRAFNLDSLKNEELE